MSQKLRYGTGSTLWIDIPADSLVADFSRVPGDVLDDPSAAVSAALLDPIGYPSIARTVVPGDRVVIALDPAVPRADAVVAGVLDALMHTAVLAEDIVVLTTRAGRGDRYRTGRLPLADGDVTTIVHDPDDKANLAYLAASKHAEPIYLNRQLCEADVIIPIGLSRPRRSLGYTGLHGGLYPVFSDGAARGRLRAPSSAIELVEGRGRPQ
jgi:lactate racemase